MALYSFLGAENMPPRSIRSMLGAMASLGFVFALQSPAAADGYNYSVGGGAEAVFHSYGEHFYVYDLTADGHAGVGIVEYMGDTNWIVLDVVWARGGSGTYQEKNYTLPEGLRVRYHACIGDYNTGSVWACNPTWTEDRA